MTEWACTWNPPGLLQGLLMRADNSVAQRMRGDSLRRECRLSMGPGNGSVSLGGGGGVEDDLLAGQPLPTALSVKGGFLRRRLIK